MQVWQLMRITARSTEGEVQRSSPSTQMHTPEQYQLTMTRLATSPTYYKVSNCIFLVLPSARTVVHKLGKISKSILQQTKQGSTRANRGLPCLQTSVHAIHKTINLQIPANRVTWIRFVALLSLKSMSSISGTDFSGLQSAHIHMCNENEGFEV